jgi:hypothetical protein
LLRAVARLRHRKLDEVLINSPRHARLETAAHHEIGFEPAASILACKSHRVERAAAHNVVDVGSESEKLLLTPSLDVHFDSEKWRVVDRDVYLFHRRHQIGPPVCILP